MSGVCVIDVFSRLVAGFFVSSLCVSRSFDGRPVLGLMLFVCLFTRLQGALQGWRCPRLEMEGRIASPRTRELGLCPSAGSRSGQRGPGAYVTERRAGWCWACRGPWSQERLPAACRAPPLAHIGALEAQPGWAGGSGEPTSHPPQAAVPLPGPLGRRPCPAPRPSCSGPGASVRHQCSAVIPANLSAVVTA